MSFPSSSESEATLAVQPDELVEQGIPIRSHWIGEIGSGRKDWELRSRPWNRRGRIGLIESGTGCVVGVATIVACHGPLSAVALREALTRHQVPPSLLDTITYAETYAYELADVRWFADPVAYVHKPGAVTVVRFDTATQRALAAALPTARCVRRVEGVQPSTAPLTRKSILKRTTGAANGPRV